MKNEETKASQIELEIAEARAAQERRRKSPEILTMGKDLKAGPMAQKMKAFAPECDDKKWHGTWFRKKDYKQKLQSGYEPAGIGKNDGALVEHEDMVMMRIPAEIYRDHLKVAPAISRKRLGDEDQTENNNPAKAGEDLTVTRPAAE